MQSFGTRHLGALTGLITMVHQIFGGIGAYLGAAVFDATGTYDIAFGVMLIASALALVLTLMLRRPASAARGGLAKIKHDDKHRRPGVGGEKNQ